MRTDLRAAAGNLPLVLGLIGALAIAFVVLFGDRIAPYDPQAWRIVEFYDGKIIVPPSPPDSHHLLGTDPLGRDQLSRLLWGARLSITVTGLAVLLRVGLGLVVGTLIAATRGPASVLVLTVTNVVSGYPQLMLALLVGVALRDLGLAGFVIALGLVGWPELGRFIAVEFTRLSKTPYVEAARAVGASRPRVALAHVMRNALPQLIGVTALETAAVLLLLAELGFIGLFVAGSVSLSDNFGAPVLPVRDRAPEWGSMLAGALEYATNRQWVAYVPALVVVAAVFVFNLLGEGVRSALDPHSSRALTPRALGWAARVAAVVVLIGVSGFALSQVAIAKGLSYDDGLAQAQAAADLERPGARLVASVVLFSSQAHALDRPAKLNYYFVDPLGSSLRVGFIDADPNQKELRFLEDDDGLGEIARLAPVEDPTIAWQEALAAAEKNGGNAYRSSTRGWLTRVILREFPSGPVYRVRYGPVSGAYAFEVPIDARTGSLDLPLPARLGDTWDQIVRQLGGDPVLIRLAAEWRSTGQSQGFGPDRSVTRSYYFARADGSGSSMVGVNIGQGSFISFIPTPFAKPPPLGSAPDLQNLFAMVEERGGRALRAEAAPAGTAQWFAFGTLERVEGSQRFTVQYRIGDRLTTFTLDVATGEVRRVS
ncbi:MAG: ABC transporter permease [Chloroflexota bacterium]|nr:ABC transporter permease [Chloroflexota bacterium]